MNKKKQIVQANCHKLIVLTIIIAFSFPQLIYAQENRKIAKADLKSVTVYSSGAEMFHAASAALGQGSNTLVIENLSNSIDLNSVQIKTDGNITIMGYEFATNYLNNVVSNSKTKVLEDSIESVQQKIDKLNILINSNLSLINILKVNTNIKGEQSGLNVAELIKLLDYQKLKSTELAAEQYQLNGKKKQLDELIQKLKNQLAEEQQKNVSSTGSLIVQIEAGNASNYYFNISYISLNASWTPFYDIKLESLNKPIKLVYRANIWQTTGIDWKKVKLSLNSGLPNQFGKSPILSSWFLREVTQYAYRNNNQYSVNQALAGKTAGVSVYEDAAVQGYAVKKNNELTNPFVSSTINDNLLSLNFEIDMPYTILTTGKPQSAVLQTFDIDATYNFYAVPKLDKETYLTANIPSWEKYSLLPAEANIILEGTYVGKTNLEPNSTNDTLNLTLGRDKRVSVKREKLIDYSSVKFFGSNKLQKFTYEITVKNNKKEDIELLLKDQFPLTTTKEIEVELIDTANAEINTDLGVLNWKLKLAAGAQKKIRFSYSVKYPKEKTLNL